MVAPKVESFGFINLTLDLLVLEGLQAEEVFKPRLGLLGLLVLGLIVVLVESKIDVRYLGLLDDDSEFALSDHLRFVLVIFPVFFDGVFYGIILILGLIEIFLRVLLLTEKFFDDLLLLLMDEEDIAVVFQVHEKVLGLETRVEKLSGSRVEFGGIF